MVLYSWCQDYQLIMLKCIFIKQDPLCSLHISWVKEREMGHTSSFLLLVLWAVFFFFFPPIFMKSVLAFILRTVLNRQPPPCEWVPEFSTLVWACEFDVKIFSQRQPYFEHFKAAGQKERNVIKCHFFFLVWVDKANVCLVNVIWFLWLLDQGGWTF